MTPKTPPSTPALPPFTGISAKAYEHPADRAATAMLHRLPFFDPLVKRMLEFTIERRMIQPLLGNSIRLGDNQLPQVWGAHRAAYTALDITAVPTLHVIQAPLANALTLGAHRPIVVLQSGSSDCSTRPSSTPCSPTRPATCSPSTCATAPPWSCTRLSRLPGIPLPFMPLRAALMAWYRSAELSCDRAAALVTRDPLTICRVLMVIAAGAEAKRLDLDVFMKQAQEYVQWDDLFDRTLEDFVTLPVLQKIAELIHDCFDCLAGCTRGNLVGPDLVNHVVDHIAQVQRVELAHAEVRGELQARVARCRLDAMVLLEKQDPETPETRILEGATISNPAFRQRCHAGISRPASAW